MAARRAAARTAPAIELFGIWQPASRLSEHQSYLYLCEGGAVDALSELESLLEEAAYGEDAVVFPYVPGSEEGELRRRLELLTLDGSSAAVGVCMVGSDLSEDGFVATLLLLSSELAGVDRSVIVSAPRPFGVDRPLALRAVSASGFVPITGRAGNARGNDGFTAAMSQALDAARGTCAKNKAVEQAQRVLETARRQPVGFASAPALDEDRGGR